MPDDVPLLRAASRRQAEVGILDTLRINMNFATVVTSETFDQFSDSPLGTVAAVHERGNNGEPQLNASKADETSGLILAQAVAAHVPCKSVRHGESVDYKLGFGL